MDLSRVYTKTSKGILEGTGKSRSLDRERSRVLALIDGKSTVSDLLEQSGRLSKNKLAALLDDLAKSGYIRPLNGAAVVADDLGFSSTIIVAEANTQAFFEAQQELERQLRRAEAAQAEEKEAKREALLAEVKADIAAEAASIKREIDQEARPQPAVKGSRDVPQDAERVREQKQREAAAAEAARRKAEQEAQARAAAEARAKAMELEARKREEAARKAKEEAERRAAAEEAARAKAERERRAREDAERKAQAEAQARAEAERKAREEAAAKARLEAEAQEAARRAAEAKARAEQEAARRAEIEARMREAEAARAKAEAEARALAQQLEQARLAAELENRVKRRLEARAKEEAEARARAEAEARARVEEESRRRAEAEAKAKAEEAARLAAERARQEAERRAREEAEAQARAAEEARRRAEAEAKARAEAEEAARLAAEQARRAREDAEARARALEEARREAARAEAEEAERKAREEAEARAAEEARHQADVEAKARADAEARAEAERIREETERRAREEAQARARAAEEVVRLAAERALEEAEREAAEAARAREEARERARAYAEEQARREAEAARREAEEEARREAEEEARLREEAEARAKAAAQKTPLPFRHRPRRPRLQLDRKTFKALGTGFAALLVLAVALVHVLSFNFHIPVLERQLATSLGEPVRIDGLRFSVYPAPHWRLEGVLIGRLSQIRIGTVRIYPYATAWFDEVKRVRRVELDSATLSEAGLELLPRLQRAQAANVAWRFERVKAMQAKLSVPVIDMFAFDGELELRDGRFARARLVSVDHRVRLDLTREEGAVRVKLDASRSVLPFAPGFEFDRLRVEGIAEQGRFSAALIEGGIYGGSLEGSAEVRWGAGWTAQADLQLKQIALELAMARVTREASVAGTLDSKLRLAAQGASLPALLEASPQVQATFRVKDGTLYNVDLVRALRTASRANAVSGGKTQFQDLTGFLRTVSERYEYSQLRLSGGALSAGGSVELRPDRTLAGNVAVELRTRTSVLRAPLAVGGSLGAPGLRLAGTGPTAAALRRATEGGPEENPTAAH